MSREFAARNTAELTVETLVAHGIDLLFGVPGIHNDALFDALYVARGRIRTIHARHEQTTGYMALGAALATGRPQAFAAVPGPGILNASAALLTAYGMQAPVLALAGQIPSNAMERGHGHLHEIRDQLGLLRHLTKDAQRIGGPADAGARLASALQLARSGRPGPVALECAIDVWPTRGPGKAAAPLPLLQPEVDSDAIEQAARLLGTAKRPLIMVGGGAQDASQSLIRVAEMLQAPVGCYRRGHGVLPGTHPLSVNLPLAHRLWRDADVVLAVGTRLHTQQSVWGVDEELKIIRIDIDPEEPGRFRNPDCSIVADAQAALDALANALPRHLSPRPHRDLAAERGWMAEELGRLAPQMAYLAAIRRALPPEGILVDEVTQMGFAARLGYQAALPRTFISGGQQDNLGYGFGTALGAKVAVGDRPVVAIAGDGGFGYQAFELATAAKHGIALVTVLFDDGAFGNVRRIQDQAYGGRRIADSLHNPDFVAYARSFGVRAVRATTPAALERTLREAIAANEPALVHVPVDEMPSPWPLIMLPRVRGKAGPGERVWP
ncbi:thiamine pyrophosphate-dependent enzyme [Sphingomonas sp. PR090111-T3T-6A]|uniref:thiamine pyrophosphate-dependent enzyme n=1 Tax=Sphingomonas sp. PR090111-T3T-6A TaxID=685778 RepID=UPI000376BA02|nr:thiamine pyrophosphate-dependent enzyme [Sphingomonas sp. PR090111-T3T-6A]